MIEVSKEELTINDEFAKERNVFPLIDAMLKLDDIYCAVNSTNTIMAVQGNKFFPMWIWNSNKLNDIESKELVEYIKDRVTNHNLKMVIVKNNVYENLRELYPYIINNTVIMNAYINKKPKLDVEISGTIDYAKKDENKIIADFLIGYDEEIDHTGLSREDALEDASGLISNPTFYVWRNEQQEIVTIGKMNYDSDTVIRINCVFTKPEERRKGYSAMLMYALCNKILEMEKIPMLYADKAYLPANKSYQNVGFQKIGEIVEIELSENKQTKT